MSETTEAKLIRLTIMELEAKYDSFRTEIQSASDWGQPERADRARIKAETMRTAIEIVRKNLT